jgi:cation diffusion facilitator CzcD-associated flavoprotein CzcO
MVGAIRRALFICSVADCIRYWNSYPGARTDTESWVYILNISKELNDDWVWPERYPSQPEMKRYFNHVVDRLDMRRHIQFNTEIKTAHYDDDKNIWTVTTNSGEQYKATYILATTGSLSASLKPPFPGLDSFKGQWFLTSNWGDKPVDFLGKRVAVVGTGATGVQIVPIVAHSAKSVTVFQRTPNYVLPGRNWPLPGPAMDEIKRNYDDLWALARSHSMGFAIPTYGRLTKDYSPEEQQMILEAGWESGGFRFIFETFDDMTTDPAANELASKFIRRKIRTVVKDKETAELLCPHYPFTVKRPPVGHHYFEAFNRDNVHLVDISKTPIDEVTPKGLRVGDDEYEFDIIIFALGFEVAVGSLTKIDIRSRGLSLQESWDDRLTTYLGVGVQDFPNLLICAGAQAPAVNAPMTVDVGIEFVGQAFEYMKQHGLTKIEPTKQAVDRWEEILNDAVSKTLIPEAAAKVGSWYVGANVPGKKHAVLLYFGGLAQYLNYCQAEVASGFSSFNLSAGHLAQKVDQNAENVS